LEAAYLDHEFTEMYSHDVDENRFNKGVINPEYSELNRAHKNQFIHYEEVAEGMEFESFDQIMNYQSVDGIHPSVSLLGQISSSDEHGNKTSYLPTKIMGSEAFVRRVRERLKPYVKAFSTQVDSIPADIPPLKLIVDDEKWEHPRNSGYARHQTQQKNDEKERQISGKSLPAKVIAKTQVVYYSQTHLTPKPNGS
jgi:hypothetical protein